MTEASKKTATKKAATGKAATGKIATKKAATGKAATGKAPTGKATTRKAATGKATTRKAAAGKAATGKTATKKAATGKAATGKARQAQGKVPRETADALEPLFLLPPEGASKQWSLCLTDADSPADLFEDEGHSGNGYAWDSVARVAMKGFSAARKKAISFDSEAGTFVALCTEGEPLVELGKALAGLIGDEGALRKAIRAVPEDDWDD